MRFKLYTVHERGAPAGADPDVVLVREGFSWPAAIFGLLWLLAHRLWLASLIYLAIAGLVAAVGEVVGLRPAADAALGLAIAVLTGYLGPEAQRWNLARRGYGMVGVIGGRNRDAAERKLFAGWPADHRAAFTPAARLSPV